MLDWALQNMQGMSLASTLAVVVLTIIGMGVLRRWVQKDNRKDLGLGENETLDQKINDAIQVGFESSMRAVLTEIRGISTKVDTVRHELEGEIRELKTSTEKELVGLRKASTYHGHEIKELLIQVSGLTAQVSGLPAVNALRSRIERKKIEAQTRTTTTDSSADGE